MIKGIVFISNVTKALEHEWFADAVNKNELQPEFVLFNSADSDLLNYLKAKGFKCTNYSLPSKFYVPLYIVYFSFRLLFRRPDFVHCHLFEASLIGIISAKLAGIRKRIHTRHHGDFHHTYFPGAVKYDRTVNRFSTHIIAVSNAIKTLLVEKEQVAPQKITVIPHGIPSALLDVVIPEKEVEHMTQKYGLAGYKPVIGVISRFVEWKGIQYIIPAFKSLLNDFPQAKLVLANAQGDYKEKLMVLLNELPKDAYCLIAFEPEVYTLYRTFDVFVHAPVDVSCEAFGQIYIECMSLGIPMVCTISGIAADLVKPGSNALVAAYKDPTSIYENIKKVVTDNLLKNKLVQQAKTDVKEYTFEKKYDKIRSIYTS